MEKLWFELALMTMKDIVKDSQKIKEKSVSDLDLKSADVIVLLELMKHQDGLTFVELTKNVSVDKANTSRVVNELIKKGFILKKDSKKYKYNLVLTDLGYVTTRDIFKEMKKIQHELGKDLSIQELNDFYKTLNKISDNLKKQMND